MPAPSRVAPHPAWEEPAPVAVQGDSILTLHEGNEDGESREGDPHRDTRDSLLSPTLFSKITCKSKKRMNSTFVCSFSKNQKTKTKKTCSREATFIGPAAVAFGS